jgi:DNA-binding response OmpR family regulator
MEMLASPDRITGELLLIAREFPFQGDRFQSAAVEELRAQLCSHREWHAKNRKPHKSFMQYFGLLGERPESDGLGLPEMGPEPIDRAAARYKRGRLIHLQDQPFQILLILLEHAGELVTREELKQVLWPNGIVVDFDESLNTAVKKLRIAVATRLRTPALSKPFPAAAIGS